MTNVSFFGKNMATIAGDITILAPTLCRGMVLAIALVVCVSSIAGADTYHYRKAPGPQHGDDPHGGDPHAAPPHDPGLPANQNDRDPYDGKEGNDRKHPNTPY